MDAWGVFRDGEGTEEREAALRRAAEKRGWAYRGTLSKKGLDLDAIGALADQARGGGLILDDTSVLATDPREAALRTLALESVGVTVALSTEGDPLESTLNVVRSRSRRSKGVRTAMQSRALRGLTLGKLPYGYRKGPRGQPEVDPEESPKVELIFQMAFQGKGIRAIVSELNGHGYVTRRGGTWSMVTVRDMLRNRFYIGVYDRFGIRVPGNHKAIITRPLFTHVQARLDKAAQKAGFAKGQPFLLSGMVVCAECGSKMIGVTRKQAWKRKDGTQLSKTYRYYQCGTRTNRGMCGYNTHPAEELEQQVLAQTPELNHHRPEVTRIVSEETAEEVRRLLRRGLKEKAQTQDIRASALTLLRQAAEDGRSVEKRRLARVEGVVVGAQGVQVTVRREGR